MRTKTLYYLIAGGFIGCVAWVLYFELVAWPRFVKENDCQRSGATRTSLVTTCNDYGSGFTCSSRPVTEYEWECKHGDTRRVWK